MRRSQIIQLSNQGKTGKSYFREKLGDIADFNLSLQVVINDKRLKEAAESINEVLREREPGNVKEARELAFSSDATDTDRRAFQAAYMRYWDSDDVQQFLREDVNLPLKIVKLSKKQLNTLSSITPDMAECLMIFTNIETSKTEENE